VQVALYQPRQALVLGMLDRLGRSRRSSTGTEGGQSGFMGAKGPSPTSLRVRQGPWRRISPVWHSPMKVVGACA
jgi:hypothetical protein